MNLLDLSAIEWGVVILAGAVAGFVNTVAGGGSLLTLPALMLAGIPPTLANGTNRVAIFMQSSTAAWRFAQAGVLNRSRALRLAVPTLTGAGLGAYAASVMSDDTLEPVILGVLVVVAALFAFRPDWVAPQDSPPDEERPDGPAAWIGLWIAGFYGGFLQAGVGFVLLAVLAGMLRLDLARASALKVALVVPYTVLALGIFAMADQVNWGIGCVLGLASMVGARLGVDVALEHTEWLRWLVLCAVVLSVVAMGLRRLG